MFHDPCFYGDDRFGPLSPGIFDGPSFPWDDYIRILLPRKTFELPMSHLSTILPRFSEHLDAYSSDLDVTRLSSTMARKLQKSRGIDRKFIAHSLGHLFSSLRSSHGQAPTFIAHIVQHLVNAITQDEFMYAEDLRQSRRTFVTWALFARRMSSPVLASALMQFFLHYRHAIIRQENGVHLGAWGLALMDLQSPYNVGELAKCFRALAERLGEIRDSPRWMPYYMFDNRWPEMIRMMEAMFPWDPEYFVPTDRGRRPVRPLLCDVSPRAHTMPPVVHRQPQCYLPQPPMQPALMPAGLEGWMANIDHRLHHVEHNVGANAPLMLMG